MVGHPLPYRIKSLAFTKKLEQNVVSSKKKISYGKNACTSGKFFNTNNFNVTRGIKYPKMLIRTDTGSWCILEKEKHC
jgi:hypothetical protein